MRIERLLEFVDKNSVLYLTDFADMRYYSNFTGEGAVVIGTDERFILTDGRYVEKAQNESEFEVINSLNHREFLKKTRKTVIVQADDISYSRVKSFIDDNIEVVVKNIDFDALRSVKDEDEIISLKNAAKIAEKSLIEILPLVKVGVTEKELAAKLDYSLLVNGAEKCSFETIFISGKNTSMPHGVPTHKKIEYGDFITVDFGCIYNGYCSDMTRTFAVGSVSDEMKNVYDAVYFAQQNAQNYIKSGVKASDVDLVARDYIKNKGYGEYFVHSTGHGVGLKIHEKPNVSSKSELTLEKNNIVTVEPGIYIPGKFGVRIENTVIVQEKCSESLQKFQKELIIL